MPIKNDKIYLRLIFTIRTPFMKTNRFLLTGMGLFFICLSTFGAPLDNWYWRNPLPNGNPQTGPQTLYGVVFAGGKFVAVGASGVVAISSDSTNWTQSATATTNTLNGIIFANGQFVAVGNGGVVETSPDGTNWSLMNSGTTNSLAAVAYANGKYVAAGGNVVIKSSNGVNWSSAVSGLSGATGLAGGSAGFVAVAGGHVSGSSNQVFFSSNGSTWTSEALTAPGNSYFGAQLQNTIVTYANGAYLIGSYRYASSASADAFIFRSTDGNFWTTNVLGNNYSGTGGFTYNFFMPGNGYLVAAGLANFTPFLQFSSDGINWSQTNDDPASINALYGGNAGTYGNGTYVIVARPSSSLPQILTSCDSLTWTNRQQPLLPPTGPTTTFTSIAFSNGVYVVGSSNSIARSSNGLVYATVSNSPALTSVITYGNGFIGVGLAGNIYVSADGLSWTQRNSGTAANLHGISAGGGLLVAVGDTGTIQTSPAGTIWTSRTSGTSLPLYDVTYSNGLFVAVGQLGTVLTSTDGINWSGQYSGQINNLVSVTYGSAGFVAVGPGGTILDSADGTNWTAQSSGTSTKLESISFGNGYYLAAGDDAVALTSPDGIIWTSRNIGATGGQYLVGSAFLNSRFDIVGSGGTIVESDPIAQLFDVQIHPGSGQNGFSIFVPPGTSFRIQACTNLSAPNWIDVATNSNASAITLWTNSSAGFNQRFYRVVSP